jgi:hypothetical protein
VSDSIPQTEQPARIRPIAWFNLPYWAYRTATANWRNYQPKQRHMSARRLGRCLLPNLKQPIFLVGAPRSGTTFLGSCLGELPEISYHFEPIATKAAARYLYEGRWGLVRARWFYRNVYAWLMRLHADGDLRFAEKTPRNAFVIPALLSMFPDGRFIHIIRDGRDAALSLSERPWLQAGQSQSGRVEPGGYRYGPYARFWVEPDRIREFESTTDIHRCIWSWRRHTEAALAAGEQLPPDRYHELRYEDLTTRPQEEANRMLAFLGITDAASREALHTAVGRASVKSVGRWNGKLSAEDLAQIEAEAGPLLARLGYGDPAQTGARDHASAS